MVATGEQPERAGMKILIVDDHVLIREALRGVLKELNAQAAIIEAPDSRQAMRHVDQHPDLQLILLDLGLPDRDGFEVLAELRQRYPAISVVVLSAHNRRDNVAKALELGALGFIPKSAQRAVMLSALNLVFAGGVYIPPEILSREQSTVEPSAATVAAVPVGRRKLADHGLSPRQIDVLALMMKGKSNKAISRELRLAEPTVENYVTAILKVLKVTNRTEAVIAAGSLTSMRRRSPASWAVGRSSCFGTRRPHQDLVHHGAQGDGRYGARAKGDTRFLAYPEVARGLYHH